MVKLSDVKNFKGEHSYGFSPSYNLGFRRAVYNMSQREITLSQEDLSIKLFEIFAVYCGGTIRNWEISKEKDFYTAKAKEIIAALPDLIYFKGEK